jgi:hypothetical protein
VSKKMNLWRYLRGKSRAKTERAALTEQLVKKELRTEIDFASWLLLQADRGDSIGDLARHITKDALPSDRMVKILEWWKTACLNNHLAAEKSFFDAFQQAWEEFKRLSEATASDGDS